MDSIWQATSKLSEYKTLHGDRKTDVLIIGGGIAGILTAYFLHQKNIQYILVEKDKICNGTTGNTTAKITFQHGLIYDKILKSYGSETASAYLQANKSALKKYSALSKKINCDYEIKDNFIYSINNRQKLENEITALDKIGYRAEFHENISVPLETVGAVCFKNQAQFHPLKFLSGIAENLNIFENTFVREIDGNTAITADGKIYADKIIITSHFPFIDKHGSYYIKLYQHRSYVIALKNAPDIHGMYMGENKKDISFRNYENYLLLGGGSHRTGKNGGNWSELRNFASRYYPKAKELFHWSAQDCMSLDDMPYIGHYSKHTNNLYTASGFNKWGMTGAMLSAMILSDMVCDIENEYTDFFTTSRNIIKPQLFINASESIINLLTFSKKRCPHLGCALKWNYAEHSWDCPCHGSRFSAGGKVLNNPANGNIKH